jgi:hypothetical protein
MMTAPETMAAVRLARELRLRGPSLARDLRTSVGLSLAIGATRSLTYAMRRAIPGLPSEIPVYEVGPGASRLFATLHPVEPAGFYVQSTFEVQAFYPDLPWFLHDLRPAGFLGRLAPRQHPELGLPPDIRLWSAEHTLRWLHEWGVDTVGSFVVGDPAFARLPQHEAAMAVPAGDRTERYPAMAEAVMSLGIPGSSAAGEQPKFLATRTSRDRTTPVLVKFSPRIADAATRRTADILRCEHHALTTLQRAGIPAAESAIVEADDRVFLEVERFDRQADGRLGLVSLLALAAHAGADIQGWSSAADGLATAGAITGVDRERIHLLDRFGELIGNSDRHAGNLSFFFADGRVGAIAPVYDMLPMRYAVRGGELATPVLVPPPPTPRFATSWRQSWAAATRFWLSVAQDEAIHDDLRRVSDANARTLTERRSLLDRLPGEAAA